MSGDLAGAGTKDGDGDEDGNEDGENQGQGEQSLEDLQKEMSNMTQQAAMQSKMAGGKVPNSIEEYLEDLYNPQLPWHQILANYMDSFAKEDYSYSKVNKQFFPHGFILPTLHSEGLGRVAIATDESGSVSNEDYKMYLGAIVDIHTRLEPEAIDMVSFTTHIVNQWEILQEDDISKINFRGSGGTHIPAVIDHFNAAKKKPQVLIIFSDMESAMPDKKPDYDVIWISVGNPRFVPPFGKVIHVQDSNKKTFR